MQEFEDKNETVNEDNLETTEAVTAAPVEATVPAETPVVAEAPAKVEPTGPSFKDFGLADWIEDRLESLGYLTPTPIQALTIPELLAGDGDVIGQAQTGTGKTAAFSLPILNSIVPGLNTPQALVLCPTRELAIQVANEIEKFSANSQFRTVTIYGGASMADQSKKMRKGADIVVGTPGRCIDFIKRGKIDTSCIKYMVLDEADEMLNMGFIEDVEFVLENTPVNKTSLMFSATMPPRLKKVAEHYLRDSKYLAVKAQQLTNANTSELIYRVKVSQKGEALTRLLMLEKDFYGIIFCRTKAEVEDVNSTLIKRGLSSNFLHGDIPQEQREKLLDRFRKKDINILVATDVAARGIDIKGLTHVINYSLPDKEDTYVHRIGRTGRAGSKGASFTLLAEGEKRTYERVVKYTGGKAKEEAQLPFGDTMVELRRELLQNNLDGLLNDGGIHKSNFDIARKLCGEHDPMEILAALIQKEFAHEFHAETYPQFKGGKDKKNRLFISVGRIDDMGAPELIAYVSETSGIPGHRIDELRMKDKFSLFSVSDADAKIILDSFQDVTNGSLKVIVKRDESGDTGGGRGRGGRDNRGGGRGRSGGGGGRGRDGGGSRGGRDGGGRGGRDGGGSRGGRGGRDGGGSRGGRDGDSGGRSAGGRARESHGSRHRKGSSQD